MRTATFPPIRVEPETRAQTEAVLREGESLSQFIEQAVRKEVEWRNVQIAFVAEARESLAEYKAHGGPTMEEVEAEIRERTRRHTESLRALAASRKLAA